MKKPHAVADQEFGDPTKGPVSPDLKINDLILLLSLMNRHLLKKNRVKSL